MDSQSIRDYVELGIVHFMAYPQSLYDDHYMVDSLESLIQEEDFDFIEVKGTDDPSLLDRMKSIIATTQTSVKYCAHPRIFSQGFNPNAIDEQERLYGVSGIYAAIDEAVSLGITDVGMPSGPYVGAEFRAHAITQLQTSLISISDYAAARRVSIYLEPFDTHIDKCRLIGSAAHAVEVAAVVSACCDNFHLMVDLSHIPLLSEDIATCVSTMAPYISHAHIGNCFMSDTEDPAYGDRHPPYDYPGSEIGVREIATYLQTLIDIGYMVNDDSRASMAFEIMPVDPDKSREAIHNAKQTLDEAWQMVEI